MLGDTSSDSGVCENKNISGRRDSSVITTGSTLGSGDSSSDSRSRQVIGLATHKDGIDIAKYIRKLEADLADLGVPRREYKTILYQKLSSKSAASIVSSVDGSSCSYEELKQILTDSLGSGRTLLGSKLVAEFNTDAQAMNPLDKYVHLKGLVDSVDVTVLDRSDVLLFFAVAIYRASLTAQQRSVMDVKSSRSKT